MGTLRSRREALGLTPEEVGAPIHVAAVNVIRGEEAQGTSRELAILTDDINRVLDLCERVQGRKP